jgi:Adenosine deaminase
MNTVLVSRDYILFIQNFGVTDIHTHDTNHLTISLDGKMNCKIDGELVNCYGYILNSQVEHQRFGENADSIKLVFVFEPGSAPSLIIRKEILKGKNYKLISEEQSKKVQQLCSCNDWESYRNKEQILSSHFITEIFDICGISEKIPNEIDHRVLYLIKRIQEEEMVKNEILHQVCDELFLSKSRLLHLFRIHIGISFKKYLQYQKFFKTWNYIAMGENITDACIHAGYSDSAHYSNFMNHCFGLSTKKELTCINGAYCID